MSSYCGADCTNCDMQTSCAGCSKTCGSPFGGTCVAAQYIRFGGKEAYRAFQEQLMREINALPVMEGLPPVTKLYELSGSFVNLEYPLPNGQKVGFLNPRDVYLGCQVELPAGGRCLGIVASSSFLLVSEYGEQGVVPELVLFQRR